MLVQHYKVQYDSDVEMTRGGVVFEDATSDEIIGFVKDYDEDEMVMEVVLFEPRNLPFEPFEVIDTHDEDPTTYWYMEVMRLVQSPNTHELVKQFWEKQLGIKLPRHLH